MEQPSQETKPTTEEIAQAASVLETLAPGYLPKPLFEQVTRLCVTPIIEVVPLRAGGSGTEVLLIQRPEDDPSWPGKLHTPGTVLRSTDVGDGIESALARLFSDELNLSVTPDSKYVGVIFHQVTRGSELALVYYADIDSQDSDGEWYPLSRLPENIVDTQIDFIKQAAALYEKEKLDG